MATVVNYTKMAENARSTQELVHEAAAGGEIGKTANGARQLQLSLAVYLEVTNKSRDTCRQTRDRKNNSTCTETKRPRRQRGRTCLAGHQRSVGIPLNHGDEKKKRDTPCCFVMARQRLQRQLEATTK